MTCFLPALQTFYLFFQVEHLFLDSEQTEDELRHELDLVIIMQMINVFVLC